MCEEKTHFVSALFYHEKCVVHDGESGKGPMLCLNIGE